MITIIQGPIGSSTTSILLCEITRIEAHTLTFFEEKVYNFYVFVEKAAQEYFYMFSYKQLQDFEQAHKQLTSLLKDPQAQDHTIQIVPSLMPAAEPGGAILPTIAVPEF
ncbi:hypothetical protein I2I11_01895 [Pontibacter sp. 172403-2]|uniref:hypothetical protein n=1 Tax=Pontibacter rufus TaxID=2791028 RepID=UPI0018AFB82A|nr:hypothetical protein [Pontibacter sp. 172403-2]MBF9252037.1 hypothetical protein [Pontibacter sp. 172403-2]